MNDFERQLDEIERKRKEELVREAVKIECESAQAGRYRSSSTVHRLLHLCEENHTALVEDFAREIRFFYERMGSSVPNMINMAKTRLGAYRSEITKTAKLEKLLEGLNMPSVSEPVTLKISELEGRANVVFRRLNIELPMLEEFMTESFQLVSKDGVVKRDEMKGRYADGQVITFDVQAQITVGDHLLRRLPNELVEDFIVANPQFTKGLDDISDSYVIDVKRSDEPAASPSQIINNITATISGPGARLNVGSTDKSVNIINTDSTVLFGQMREAANREISDPTAVTEVISRIDALEAATGTIGFGDRYNEFVTSAAAHTTVFLPFFPALTKLLTG